MTDAIAASELSLTLTRRFAAPREAVFAAWTDPRQMARWMGPRSMRAEILEADARPGGRYRLAMHQAEGSIHVVGGSYREVAPPDRLVFTWKWEEHPASNIKNHQSLITVTFNESEGATEMTMHQLGFSDAQSCDSHRFGWNGSFDNLEDILAGRKGPRD
jgi:uncharacterized protein YndB with AHSA1/START domain